MSTPTAVPAPLTAAASLAALEGLVLLGLGVLELADLTSSRVALGVTTAVFFLAYAGLVLAAAWALSRAQPWARGPVLLTQLMTLGVAWGTREVLPAVLTASLVLVAVVTLAGLVHPASVERLGREREAG